MADNDKTVFISYRRNVSSFIARAIFMDLRQHGYDVFMDVESIDSGEFDRVILNQIAARAHFVLILTPGSVERCVEPNDWLRHEIEHALELKRNVVPLLINGFTFVDTEKYLTGQLSEVAKRNSLPIYHEYFEEGMEKLRKRFLKQPINGQIVSAPASDQSIVDRKMEGASQSSLPTKPQLEAEKLFGQGVVWDDMGDTDKAMDSYSAAIQLNPEYFDAYFNRGVAYANKGEYERAIAEYTKAISLRPHYAGTYHGRGLAYRGIKDYEQALANFDEAIRLKPDYVKAFYNRATTRQDMGDLEGAIADYETFLELKGGKQFSNESEVKYSIGRLKKKLRGE